MGVIIACVDTAADAVTRDGFSANRSYRETEFEEVLKKFGRCVPEI